MNITQIVKLLRDKNIKLTTAESCTGGMLAEAITAISGASAVFDRGFITYSNEAKHEQLGVAKTLIKTNGAVSDKVAIAMAEGALAKSNSQLAISVTGIAGPEGGTPNKPVGTVYIGLCAAGEEAVAHHFEFTGNRTEVRQQSVAKSLLLIEQFLS